MFTRLVVILTAAAAITGAALTTPTAAARPNLPAAAAVVQYDTAAEIPPPYSTALLSTPSYAARAGDTLWAIAVRFCGRGGVYPQLAAASGISDPNRIRIGAPIVLACRAAPAASRSATRAPVTRIGTVLAYALSKVGHRYVWGTAGPSTFDCSGLVMAAYSRIGIRLPHQSGAMLRYGKRVTRNELRPGDIVWPFYGHVMLYLGNGWVVEAANHRVGVIRSRLYGFMTARRII